MVFSPCASDLVAGDTNATSDIFSFHVASGELTHVSRGAKGEQLTGRSLLPGMKLSDLSCSVQFVRLDHD